MREVARVAGPGATDVDVRSSGRGHGGPAPRARASPRSAGASGRRSRSNAWCPGETLRGLPGSTSGVVDERPSGVLGRRSRDRSVACAVSHRSLTWGETHHGHISTTIRGARDRLRDRRPDPGARRPRVRERRAGGCRGDRRRPAAGPCRPRPRSSRRPRVRFPGIDVSHHQGVDRLVAGRGVRASGSRSRRRPRAAPSSIRTTRSTRPAPRCPAWCSARTTSRSPTAARTTRSSRPITSSTSRSSNPATWSRSSTSNAPAACRRRR